MRPDNLMPLILALGLAACAGNDQFDSYLQRKDTVTLSAGDAGRQNAVAQTLQTWPPGVGDRQIPMDGTRAANAMQTYRCDNAQKGPIQTQTQTQTVPTGGGGSASTAVSQTGRAKTAEGC